MAFPARLIAERVMLRMEGYFCYPICYPAVLERGTACKALDKETPSNK